MTAKILEEIRDRQQRRADALSQFSNNPRATYSLVNGFEVLGSDTSQAGQYLSNTALIPNQQILAADVPNSITTTQVPKISPELLEQPETLPRDKVLFVVSREFTDEIYLRNNGVAVRLLTYDRRWNYGDQYIYSQVGNAGQSVFSYNASAASSGGTSQSFTQFQGWPLSGQQDAVLPITQFFAVQGQASKATPNPGSPNDAIFSASNGVSSLSGGITDAQSAGTVNFDETREFTGFDFPVAFSATARAVSGNSASVSGSGQAELRKIDWFGMITFDEESRFSVLVVGPIGIYYGDNSALSQRSLSFTNGPAQTPRDTWIDPEVLAHSYDIRQHYTYRSAWTGNVNSPDPPPPPTIPCAANAAVTQQQQALINLTLTRYFVTDLGSNAPDDLLDNDIEANIQISGIIPDPTQCLLSPIETLPVVIPQVDPAQFGVTKDEMQVLAIIYG